jgi:hypothetical protein
MNTMDPLGELMNSGVSHSGMRRQRFCTGHSV